MKIELDRATRRSLQPPETSAAIFVTPSTSSAQLSPSLQTPLHHVCDLRSSAMCQIAAAPSSGTTPASLATSPITSRRAFEFRATSAQKARPSRNLPYLGNLYANSATASFNVLPHIRHTISVPTVVPPSHTVSTNYAIEERSMWEGNLYWYRIDIIVSSKCQRSIDMTGDIFSRESFFRS